jgi:hypothetical protein
MFINAVVIRERVILRKSSQLGNVTSLVMLYVIPYFNTKRKNKL